MGSVEENCIDASMPKVEVGTNLTMVVSKRLSSWIARNMHVGDEKIEIVLKKASWSFDNSLLDVQKLLLEKGVVVFWLVCVTP